MITFFFILIIMIAILIVAYALFSIYLRKPFGLLIAALLHIALGILLLSSFSIYLFLLALIEVVGCFVLAIRKRTT